jgi:hypothetical protein
MNLFQDGVSIVPLLSQEKTRHYRQQFQNIQFPEFIQHDGSYVMGGFGAYGNPASFHNPIVRELRMETTPHMTEFFKRQFQGAFPEETFYIERLFDRMCVRKTGTTIPKETWHRDLNPMTMVLVDKKEKLYTPRSNEHIFGGWINLDDTPQYFSCALSTHTDPIVLKKGRSESGFTAQEKASHDIKPTKVPVPPGHAVVFYQRILHQVAPHRYKQDSFRQFQLFRIVCSSIVPEPLFPRETIHKWIHDQATPLLPSGQHPPMFSSNHSSIYLFRDNQHDPIEFSKKIHPHCLKQQTCHSGKNKGRSYTIVHRFMTSLREYGLPLYPSYKEEETKILFPQKLF